MNTLLHQKNHPRSSYAVPDYQDNLHAEDLAGLQIGDCGYKYRMLEGRVMPPYITPSRYQYSQELRMREGDICYTSFPKSGSTWLAYILVLMINEGEIPEGQTLRSCLNWVASSWTYPRSKEEVEALPSPRIFKSHMPYDMAVGGTPSVGKGKHIYIARNPKDVAVSYYYFERRQNWSGKYDGPWEHWLEMFLDGKVQRGDWFDHVFSWWKHHTADNILFLRYEDLRLDYENQLRRIAQFLGYPMDDDMLQRILDQTSFSKMSRTRFSNMHEIRGFEGFFRKGKVGSWADQFTPEQSRRFDAVYAERMSGSGLEFNFG
ncbi:MAG: sulfotransferase domain-containing protein [Verrucomicrobiae bacterium]|nr:sulfotransferase domain-containing protein [Verrucomicrobiae bacterium]